MRKVCGIFGFIRIPLRTLVNLCKTSWVPIAASVIKHWNVREVALQALIAQLGSSIMMHTASIELIMHIDANIVT